MQMEADVFIRSWGQDDLEIVRDFVVSLAIFEKEPEAVTATLSDYEQAFQADLISGHLAFLKDECIGMTLFYETFSTWKGKILYLEDFIVKDEYRGLGIGQKLFDAYQQEASRRKCKVLKWQVLDWNEPAVRFYRKNGAEVDSQWWTCRKFV